MNIMLYKFGGLSASFPQILPQGVDTQGQDEEEGAEIRDGVAEMDIRNSQQGNQGKKQRDKEKPLPGKRPGCLREQPCPWSGASCYSGRSILSGA
jgi:hypothetical protein